MNNQIQLVLKSSTTELSLNDHELGIYLVPELDGLTGLPEIRTTSGVNSGYDGGWTSAQHYDARSITIRGVIANTDVATVERLRKQLVSLAGQGKQEELTLDLVTEAGNAYTLQVRTIALEMAMKGVLEKQEFMLQLRADDPLIYDNAESTHEAYIQVSKATGGFTIDFGLPLAITGGSEETVISNDGLEQVPTITRLYGELHNPKIINQTTNQSMQVNADLGFSEGQWVDPSEVVTGKTISIEDAPNNAPLVSFQLDGETSQNGTPTPSAPVAVQTVTGENVVKICGKNLLSDELQSTWTSQATTSTINGSTWTIVKGANNGIGLNPRTDYLPVSIPSGTTATFSSYPVSGTVSAASVYYQIRCYWYDKDKNLLGNTSTATTAVDIMAQVRSASYTPTTDVAYIRLGEYIPADSGTTTEAVLHIQLELGNQATAYEPYQGQSYEVNLGKNLFDNQYYKTHKSDFVNAYQGYYFAIELGNEFKNQITASMALNGTAQTGLVFALTDSIGSAPSANSRVMATDGSITTRSYDFRNSSHVYLQIGATTQQTALNTGIDALMDNYNIQVELGLQATSYAAYFTPIELCKIGDYQDYIYKSGDKWYVHKAVGKVSATSSDFNSTSSSGGYYRAVIALSGIANDSQSGRRIGDAITNLFHGSTADGAGVQFQTQGSMVVYANSTTQTYAELMTVIDSSNMVVYYALATPTDTEITNATLVGQLDALLNTARTYAGVNNIFTVTPNEQGTLEISYYTNKTADNRDELVIDSRLRTVTLNGLDIYHLIETGSEFLMLAPGENKLSLQSDITGDNGYAEVSYKQGYLSI